MDDLRQLTTVERRELKTLEQTVDNGLKAAFDVGRALRQIRDSQLYQYLDMTWEGYLKKRWPQEISRTYSHYLIEGATVADQLKGLVIEGRFTNVNDEATQPTKKPPKCEVGKDLELNECQTRELSKIEDETERADILASSVTFTKDGKPTLSAAAIRKERLERQGPKPEKVVPKGEAKKLARKKAISRAEYLMRDVDDLARASKNKKLQDECIKLCSTLIVKLRGW